MITTARIIRLKRWYQDTENNVDDHGNDDVKLNNKNNNINNDDDTINEKKKQNQNNSPGHGPIGVLDLLQGCVLNVPRPRKVGRPRALGGESPRHVEV